MQYVGGKARIAKKLAPVILEFAKGRTLIEPFCGGLSMTEQLHPVYASDASVTLISLIQAMRNGWDPPDNVSEAEYAYARTLPPTHPAHGFCGFGCSYGAVLWSKYARCDKIYPSSGRITPQNYAHCARNSLLRQIAATRSTEFGCCNYDAWEGNSGTAFYCDPPYANTTGYKGTVFDTVSFWQWCLRQTAKGSLVLVSEFEAPSNIASCIAEFSNTTRMHVVKRSRITIERLFMVR
jgi:DNA adenine methylase